MSQFFADFWNFWFKKFIWIFFNHSHFILILNGLKFLLPLLIKFWRELFNLWLRNLIFYLFLEKILKLFFIDLNLYFFINIGFIVNIKIFKTFEMTKWSLYFRSIRTSRRVSECHSLRFVIHICFFS